VNVRQAISLHPYGKEGKIRQNNRFGGGRGNFAKRSDHLCHNQSGFFMDKQELAQFYDKAHKRLGRKFHIYYLAIGAIRSMYWSGNLTIGDMYEKAKEKLETKVARKKVLTWFGVIDFIKKATFSDWFEVLAPFAHETKNQDVWKSENPVR
jgi:hypothetical protein